MDDSSNPTDEQLRTWYQQTAYQVFSPSITLRIGCPNSTLDELLTATQTQTYAFITAYNPLSNPTPQAINLENQNKLRQLLIDRGLPHYAGAGIADQGDWPPEPSFLVLGISRIEARDLGKAFRQKAIVFGKFAETPQLIFLA